ncbi:MAG: hypothetical protein K9J16_10100 [Melioribacteraceae bacterium]|nr:hypothetical protein [Melioribacteraceae bacterium]MCF8354287.1 hypothetical protein [Melioribacteraceae bacterium]MCF8394581.1 hypothetical protein [Melioribacteraceae bacterium]MCF8419750.1 hypothetical protein [Melioribacteraceae bacterium]
MELVSIIGYALLYMSVLLFIIVVVSYSISKFKNRKSVKNSNINRTMIADSNKNIHKSRSSEKKEIRSKNPVVKRKNNHAEVYHINTAKTKIKTDLGIKVVKESSKSELRDKSEVSLTEKQNMIRKYYERKPRFTILNSDVNSEKGNNEIEQKAKEAGFYYPKTAAN